MNTDDKLDQVSDTIAFLLARIRGDTDTALAILNGDSRGGEFAGPDLLMGMTDLAMAMAIVMAPLIGSTAEELVRTMALGAKMHGPDFFMGREGK